MTATTKNLIRDVSTKKVSEIKSAFANDDANGSTPRCYLTNEVHNYMKGTLASARNREEV